MVHGDPAKGSQILGEINLTNINVNSRPIEFADKLIPIVRMEYDNLGACHGWTSTFKEWDGLSIIKIEFETTDKEDK